MFAEFLAASVLPIPVRGFNIEHLGSELLVVVATTIAGWYFRLIRGKSIGKQKLNCASCHNNPVIVAVKVRPRVRSLLMALVFLLAAATALLSLFREAGLAHTLWRDFAVWTSAHVGFDTEWFQVGSTALLALLALVIGLTGWKTHYECELSGEVAEHKGSGRFRHQGDEGRKGPSPAQVKELRL